MAISQLPQATIRLLGSAQALTTPLSLVKELIDNALDAKATSVDIIISQNTLDKIEVRDNGHGIPQEDLDALGRHGHTSKLKSFEELRSIGGVSLGFRGEALASAVQLGEVSVTTKTEGEAVATAVKLKPLGGIASQTRTSHPVGTTVSVKNFISNIPVRKQTALKGAAKTLAKIKELLQGYALARPTIRFSLKVAKESKGSWYFSPRPSDGMREAVSQVIGRDAAMECIQKSSVFPESNSSSILPTEPEAIKPTPGSHEPSSQSNEDHFVVEVFLPKPDANPSKIGHGQYLSIDSRPVSHEKGTMRKIVALFKSYVKESLTGTSEKIKNPFLRLNIRCPVASYDPNVEPAKDDVLFGNESLVIESIEGLFKGIYGGPKTASAVSLQQSLGKKMDNFELLLARKHVEPPPTSSLQEVDGAEAGSPTLVNNSVFDSTLASPKTLNHAGGEENAALTLESDSVDVQPHSRSSKWGFDMFKDLSEEVDGSQKSCRATKLRPPGTACNPDYQILTEHKNDLNPWVIAKMNAPVRRSDTTTVVALPVDRDGVQKQPPIFPPTPRRSLDPPFPESDHQNWADIGTRRRRMSSPGDNRSMVYPAARVHSHSRHETSDDQNIKARLHRKTLTVDHDDVLLFGDDAGQFSRKNDFISAREAALASHPIIQRQNSPKRIRDLDKPFISPLRTVENPVSQDSLRQTTLRAMYQPPPFEENNPQDSLQQEAHPDLTWAMDFEGRKEEATRQRRHQIRAARLVAAAELVEADTDVVRSSPHKNRYNAALANLEGQGLTTINNAVKEPFKTALADGDPRAYLMRRQRSMSLQSRKPGEPPKPMRAKSTKLPLERIPETEQLHTLVLTVPTNIDSIRRIALELVKDDSYAGTGNQASGLLMAVVDTPEVIRRIQAVAVRWSEIEKGKNYEFDYNFGNMLQMTE